MASGMFEDGRKSMRAFYLSTRALFLEDNTLTSSSAAPRFEKLRNDTQNVAVAYAKGGLPLVKQCVSDIKGYFEYYIDLTRDEWWTSIADKEEKVKAHTEACNALLEIHEYFITELKTLEDDANILIEERPDVAAKCEDEANKLKMSALGQGAVGAALSYIPQLSGPVTHAMGQKAMSSAMGSMDQSTKKNQQASAEIAVVAVIRDTVVPALSEFINVLNCISGLVAVLQYELKAIQDWREKAMERNEPNNLHYKVMKMKAKRIVNYCNDFIYALPSIRSDLQAIPIKGLDDHYVERFLVMANECISKNCTNTKMINKMKKALTTGDKKQVIIDSMLEGWSLLENYASAWGVSPQKLPVFIVFVFIVLFEYFPRALLALIFLALLAYFLFV